MQLTQTLRRAAQTRGARAATVFEGRVRTWGEMLGRVCRIAGGLQGHGVGPGDRVAVLALNSDRYLEAFYATAWAGAIVVPLNTRWALAEILHALRECEPLVLMVDDSFTHLVPGIVGQIEYLGTVVYLGDRPMPEGLTGYEDLTAGPPVPDASGAEDDIVGIFYTGGTTGHPKGVMLSNRNVVQAALNWIADLHFTDDTRFMHVAGLFHLAGTAPALALTMAGGTHVLLPKFDPIQALRTIEVQKITYLLLVPTMLNTLVNHPDIGRYDLTSVGMCEYGGSPMPDALVLAAQRHLPGWRFIQGYGLTETTGVVVTLQPDRHVLEGPKAGKLTSIGRPSYACEVRVITPSGEDVRPGEIGEIVVRGPLVSQGYWRQPAATAALFRDGWLLSGDGARIDEQGFIYLVDRIKDMVISGGENVYSVEVESAIYRHEAVQECAVVGVPDAHWGEAVHAIVVLKQGRSATPQALLAHCRTLIAGYKCPRTIDVREEALPKSAAGKILKHVLRNEAKRHLQQEHDALRPDGAAAVAGKG